MTTRTKKTPPPAVPEERADAGMSEVLRQLGEAEKRAQIAEEESARLRQALEDIINPVGKIRREMPEGHTLDGVMACRLAEMPSHLRGIAQKALDGHCPARRGEVEMTLADGTEVISQRSFLDA